MSCLKELQQEGGRRNLRKWGGGSWNSSLSGQPVFFFVRNIHIKSLAGKAACQTAAGLKMSRIQKLRDKDVLKMPTNIHTEQLFFGKKSWALPVPSCCFPPLFQPYILRMHRLSPPQLHHLLPDIQHFSQLLSCSCPWYFISWFSSKFQRRNSLFYRECKFSILAEKW